MNLYPIVVVYFISTIVFTLRRWFFKSTSIDYYFYIYVIIRPWYDMIESHLKDDRLLAFSFVYLLLFFFLFFVCVNLYTITRLSFSNHSLIFIGFWNRKFEKHNMKYQIRYSWEDDEISSFCIYVYISISLSIITNFLIRLTLFRFFFVCVLTTHILDDPDGWLVCPKYCRSIYNQIWDHI